MPVKKIIKIALRTPNAASRARLERALAFDSALKITDEDDPQRDITLVHADLLLWGAGAATPKPDVGALTIVAYAPDNPALLAQYLAAGFRGYHCVGESWSRLLAVVHTVHAGEIRSDPTTMNELLTMYLRLRRAAAVGVSPSWNGRYSNT